MALIESASVHRELLQLSIVDIAFSHDSALLIIAFFLSSLYCELLNAPLVVELVIEDLCEDGHV